jgi:hypothetical protein
VFTFQAEIFLSRVNWAVYIFFTGTLFIYLFIYLFIHTTVEHPVQKYDIDCPSSNPANPQQLFNCTIENEEFKTLIDHADT